MKDLPPSVLPDTNYLLDFPELLSEKWKIPFLEILISETVVSELHGLTKNKDTFRARKAKIALDIISQYKNPFAETFENPKNIKIRFIDRFTDLKEPLDSSNPDHQLIAFARKQLRQESSRFCAILSNDKELCDIAEALAVYTISRQNELRFHQELVRKYEWWKRSKAYGQLEEIPDKQTGTLAPINKPKNAQFQLTQSIKQLYRRIDAVGCRATIFLAPIKGRLALTLELINRLRNPDQQVVIVVVQNRSMAQYWAGELRQMGKFTSEEVVIFSIDPIDRIDQAKVVIYRHDQIARRFPQHVSRLLNAEKRITAVVDGCDLLDPVELAILLYECDQFIGLTHMPLGYRRTRGHRMLNLALHNHSVMDYSFSDAERDAWGHPCDLYLNKIQFTEDERIIWNEINTGYLNQRDRAIREYPALGNMENFWEELDRLLKRAARPEMVDLIKNREQLEQMAQIAQNKLERVKQLVLYVNRKNYRRIIFDFSRQWTPVLLNQLSQMGINVAELPGGESQRRIWDQFSGNQIDTLLVSDVPAIELPHSYIHQLIVLTPLRPMDEVLAMIDWTLLHTQPNDSLRLDLLYVDDTPEELAMMELAEASFDLQS